MAKKKKKKNRRGKGNQQPPGAAAAVAAEPEPEPDLVGITAALSAGAAATEPESRASEQDLPAEVRLSAARTVLSPPPLSPSPPLPLVGVSIGQERGRQRFNSTGTS